MNIAVLDIGSNSLKISVFGTRAVHEPLMSDVREVRISTGITRHNPQIQDAALERCIPALRELLREANASHPDITLVVGTSALRDATNKDVVCARIEAEIGHPVRVLTGQEEALAIANGVLHHPENKHINAFTILDLGGGSLECIRCEGGFVKQAESLQIGSVRLAEVHLKDFRGPTPPEVLAAIKHSVLETFAQSPFTPTLDDLPLLATSGAATITRLIFANRDKTPFLNSPRELPTSRIRALRDELAQLSAAERSEAALGLPPARADVFPVSLTILLSVLDHTQATELIHASSNLRQGIACQYLKNSSIALDCPQYA
jgi:exopolyphosphatase/guanosine-5'-triphosphate,3'-diphosphate pyrophosphatase